MPRLQSRLTTVLFQSKLGSIALACRLGDKHWGLRILHLLLVSSILFPVALATSQESGLDRHPPMGDGPRPLVNAYTNHLNAGNRAFPQKVAGRISRLTPPEGEKDGLNNLKVYIVRNSRVVKASVSDAEGRFDLSDVPAGEYALCAVSDQGFLAFGIRVEAGGVARRIDQYGYRWAALSGAQLGEQELDVDAAVVPPSFNALNRITSRYLPTLSQQVSPDVSDDELIEEIDSRSVVNDISVQLDANGTLSGRMAPLTKQRGKASRLREMNAFLIQDDEIYARVSVAEDGSFEFLDVEPGLYSFAAAGEEGFAAIGFKAVPMSDDPETVQQIDGDRPFVSLLTAPPAGIAGSLTVPLCPATESGFVANQLAILAGGQQQSGQASLALPPPGGPASMGGGGGGDGLGLGGLGTAAFFAAGLAGALTDDDDGGFGAPFPGTNDPNGGGGEGPQPGPGGGAVPEPETWLAWSLIALAGTAGWFLKRRKNLSRLT
jgi:hypothetical protein